MNLSENRVSSYVPAEVILWLQKESKKRATTESAIIRELLMQAVNEAKNAK